MNAIYWYMNTKLSKSNRFKELLNNGFNKFQNKQQEYNYTLLVLKTIKNIYNISDIKGFKINGVRNITQTLYDELNKTIKITHPELQYILNKYYYYNGDYTIIKCAEKGSNRNKFLNEFIVKKIKEDILLKIPDSHIIEKYKVGPGSVRAFRWYIFNDYQFEDENKFKTMYEKWIRFEISLIKFSESVFETQGCSSIMPYILRERNLPHQTFYRKLVESANARNIVINNLSGHDIRDVYISQNKRCYYSGRELVMFFRTTDTDGDSASLDRIDSSKDYSKDNIRILSKEMNVFKNCKSDENFENNCIQVITEKMKRLNMESSIINTIKSLSNEKIEELEELDSEKLFDKEMKNYIYIQ